jgi:hypothetical protein
MVCLGQLEKDRARVAMAQKNSNIIIDPAMLEKMLSEVFYKSSVEDIMKIVGQSDGIELEDEPKVVVQMTDDEKKWFKDKEQTRLEKRVGRTKAYYKMSASDQWAEDKRKGILDWDGTEEWLDGHGF